MSNAPPRAGKLSVAEYAAGVRACDRMLLGRALTLIESNTAADQRLAQELLVELLPHAGGSQRIGVTGVPGVGKSTFIDTLGSLLTQQGHKVAVLAIDPTSGVTQGSILGDKTRMARLVRDPNAFVRPSPSGGSLGGVARKTRESVLLCEAAGFDVVLIETVGVGQSETVVADMVDCFLVLMLPGAGDELQGIKRGILELADVIAVNKADANVEAARNAKRDYSAALRVMHGAGGGQDGSGWQVPVQLISAQTGDGVELLWTTLQQHRAALQSSGRLEQKRREQLRGWMWSMVERRLLVALREHPEISKLAPQVEADVLAGKLTPTLGARALLEAFGIEP